MQPLGFDLVRTCQIFGAWIMNILPLRHRYLFPCISWLLKLRGLLTLVLEE